MDQISRPLQIVLLCVVLFAAAWFVALRPKDDVAGAPETAQPVQQQTTQPSPTTTRPAQRTEPTQPERPTASTTTSEAVQSLGPVRRALTDGDVVVLLFWDPRADVDREVRRSIRAVDRHDGEVTVLARTTAQLSRYKRITNAVKVMGTPTVVIVDRKREASTITGFTETGEIDFAVDQALAAGR
jgi:hypothetical protein